jgi:hypothetical protein
MEKNQKKKYRQVTNEEPFKLNVLGFFCQYESIQNVSNVSKK